MSDSQAYETHRYRLVWWKRWPLLILGLLVLETLRTFPEVIYGVYNSGEELSTWAVGVISMFMALLLGLLFMLVGELLFSFLEVSAGGIRVRLWPFQTIECTWDEIDSITQNRIFSLFPYAALNLIHAERVSFASTAVLKQSIVLSDFRGWPQGELAEDMRFYAPRLFGHAEKLQSLP